jgi:hypothetical protein
MFEFKSLLGARKKLPVTVEQAEAIVSKAQAGIVAAEGSHKQCRDALNESILDSTLAGKEVPAKHREAMAQADRDLAFAKSNLDAADAILEAAQEADRKACHSAQVDEVEKHLDERSEAVIKLSDAIAAAADCYREVQRLTIAAESVGLPIPAGSMVRIGELTRAVQYELYRVGTDTVNKSRSFPGGEFDNFNHIDNPAVITPLVDVIKQAKTFTINQLRGGL